MPSLVEIGSVVYDNDNDDDDNDNNDGQRTNFDQKSSVEPSAQVS